ncbi:hypothetical protein [Chelativorans salis]
MEKPFGTDLASAEALNHPKATAVPSAPGSNSSCQG